MEMENVWDEINVNINSTSVQRGVLAEKLLF